MPYPLGFDPFHGTLQATRLRAHCKVWVNGFDVTNRLMPFLESVRVRDGENPSADIELDDRDARLDIPPPDSSVKVELGWSTENMVTVFEGMVDDVEHSFTRETGRHMTVRAFGLDFRTAAKTPMQSHLGAGAPPGSEIGMQIPMIAMFNKVAKSAGLTVQLHPKLAQLTRDYWSQMNESAVHYMNRITKEHGGIMRVEKGNKVVATLPGYNPDGTETGIVICKWADNLISYKVRPISARSQWLAGNQRWYSWLEGQWKGLSKQFGLNFPGNVTAQYALPAPAPNSSVAGQQAMGMRDRSYSADTGHIIINGEPTAKWLMTANIEGVRPGVDGGYEIVEAEHFYSRGGYITTLQVRSILGVTGAAGILYSGGPYQSATGTAPASGPSQYPPVPYVNEQGQPST